jgi:hypothetical protein
VDLVSPEGRTMCCYPLDGHGWATLKAAADGRHLYVGNYFTGQLVKLELESGEHVAVADTGVERSLAGIAEYVGEAGSTEVAQPRRASRAGRVTPSSQAKRSRSSRRAQPGKRGKRNARKKPNDRRKPNSRKKPNDRRKPNSRKKPAPLRKVPRRNQQRTASGARSAGRRKLRQRPSRPRKK